MGGSLSAICVGCTGAKNALPGSFLSQFTLMTGDQVSVSREWERRLRCRPVEALLSADALYAGKGVVRARILAAAHDTDLFVISAGLGLVRGDTHVPAYDLTISNVPGGVKERVEGKFLPAAWWASVVQGPYSAPMKQMTLGRGRIVVALSHSYAAMVGPWLAALPVQRRERLRILGASLDRVLPPSLISQWIRYDDRLDAVAPGIRLHFATRAMEHFLSICGQAPIADATSDQKRVDEAFRNISMPERRSRPRLSDDALTPMVVAAMAGCGSMARALNHLRNVEGVACSHERFRFLVQQARI